MKTPDSIPFIAIHPGFVLRDELAARGISQREFAQDIGMQPTMLNEIIREKRAVTPEIALLFEKALDIPADSWLRLQAHHDLDLIRIHEKHVAKSRQVETWQIIKQHVPISVYNRLGILSASLADNIARIWDIYDVDSPDRLVELVSSSKLSDYYRKSEKLKNDPLLMLGWNQLAKWQVKSQEVGPFRSEARDELVKQLKATFLVNREVVQKVQFLLNRYGIKFLVLERFKQSPIDGYSFWSGNNPAIVLTLRKKQLDNLAFTLFHELGHVFLHLRSDPNADFLEGDFVEFESSDRELEAHRFAQQCFIPDEVWEAFMEKYPKFDNWFTEPALIELAKQHQIHPSILFGRYCFETRSFALRSRIDRNIK